MVDVTYGWRYKLLKLRMINLQKIILHSMQLTIDWEESSYTVSNCPRQATRVLQQVKLTHCYPSEWTLCTVGQVGSSEHWWVSQGSSASPCWPSHPQWLLIMLSASLWEHKSPVRKICHFYKLCLPLLSLVLITILIRQRERKGDERESEGGRVRERGR